MSQFNREERENPVKRDCKLTNLKRVSSFESVILKPIMSIPNRNNNGKVKNGNYSLKYFVRKRVHKVPSFKSIKKYHYKHKNLQQGSKPTNVHLSQFTVKEMEPSLSCLGTSTSEEIEIPKKVPTLPICEGQLLGLQYIAKCDHQNFSFDDEYSILSSSSDLSHIFIESQEENTKVPDIIFSNYPCKNNSFEIKEEANRSSLPTESELRKMQKELKYTKYGSVYSNLTYCKKPQSWLHSPFSLLQSDHTPNESRILTYDKPKQALLNPFSQKHSCTNREQTPVIVSQSTKQDHSMLENPFLIPNYDDHFSQSIFFSSNLNSSPSQYKLATAPKNTPNTERNFSMVNPFHNNIINLKAQTQCLNDYLELSPNSFLKNRSSRF